MGFNLDAVSALDKTDGAAQRLDTTLGSGVGVSFDTLKRSVGDFYMRYAGGLVDILFPGGTGGLEGIIDRVATGFQKLDPSKIFQEWENIANGGSTGGLIGLVADAFGVNNPGLVEGLTNFYDGFMSIILPVVNLARDGFNQLKDSWTGLYDNLKALGIIDWLQENADWLGKVAAVGALIGLMMFSPLGPIVAFGAFLVVAEKITDKLVSLKAWFDKVKGAIDGMVGALKIDSLGDVFGVGKSILSKAVGLDGARAEGGPVNAGGNYLVGERGPEVFTPSISGQIINNKQMASSLQGSLAGTGQEIVVNITTTLDGKVVARNTVQHLEHSAARGRSWV